MADEVYTAPVITELLHVDVTTDETCALILVRLENGTVARFPIVAAAAARLGQMLTMAREKHGWPLPDEPPTATKVQ